KPSNRSKHPMAPGVDRFSRRVARTSLHLTPNAQIDGFRVAIGTDEYFAYLWKQLFHRFQEQPMSNALGGNRGSVGRQHVLETLSLPLGIGQLPARVDCCLVNKLFGLCLGLLQQPFLVAAGVVDFLLFVAASFGNVVESIPNFRGGPSRYVQAADVNTQT